MTATQTAAPPTAPPGRIALADLGHLGAVVDLYAAFVRGTGREMPDAERRGFGDWALGALRHPDQRVWVALVGRHPRGFRAAAYVEIPFGPYPRAVHGVCLYVDPALRGQGVARRLDAAMAAWAEERGVPMTGQCEAPGVAFWEHLGWRMVGHLMAKES